MRRIFHISLSILLQLFLMTSCMVHEFPVPTDRELTLRLEFDTSVPLFETIELGPDGTRTKAGEGELQRRYMVRAYYKTKTSDTRNLSQSWTFIRPASDGTDITLKLDDFPLGTFRVLVWSDYSINGADYLYGTDDFAEIALMSKDGYQGSTDMRDAFRGDVEVNEKTSDVVVPMIRPMAKFSFITTDLEQFIDDVRSKYALLNETGEDGSSKGPNPDHVSSAILSGYGVRFIYPMYMAYSFNMFTNRPADSWTGVQYESRIEPIDDHTALMGFDYVFVNSHDTAIKVMLEVYDLRDGEVVARIPALDVPLRRSHHTIVRGPLLTTKAGGVPSIDPSFDGDFNVPVY